MPSATCSQGCDLHAGGAWYSENLRPVTFMLAGIGTLRALILMCPTNLMRCRSLLRCARVWRPWLLATITQRAGFKGCQFRIRGYGTRNNQTVKHARTPFGASCVRAWLCRMPVAPLPLCSCTVRVALRLRFAFLLCLPAGHGCALLLDIFGRQMRSYH